MADGRKIVSTPGDQGSTPNVGTTASPDPSTAESVDGSGDVATGTPGKTWGIYIYFPADFPDPQMQAAVWSTLQTIALVASNETVKITAMIDLPGRDTEYYIIPR